MMDMTRIELGAIFLIFFFLMLCCMLSIYFLFQKREKKQIDRLQEMIDDAINGTFQAKTLDESKFSSLENSMNRYLADCEMSSQNLSLQKEKIQTLISDISHQTVTPISNIMLYSQLLEEQEEQPKEEIAAIREQTEKLDFLIQSLVKLSRLETGIIAVAVKEEEITKIWEAIRNQLTSKAEQKKIILLLEETDIKAMFDLKWTIEAFLNLVDNAIKYTPMGGTVTICAESYSFFVRIDIKDTGIGIEEKEQSKIFTRFYRSMEVSEEQGVGIGLYLAREVIQAQKGYMKVVSKKGEGSTFSVFLPL